MVEWAGQPKQTQMWPYVSRRTGVRRQRDVTQTVYSDISAYHQKPAKSLSTLISDVPSLLRRAGGGWRRRYAMIPGSDGLRACIPNINAGTLAAQKQMLKIRQVCKGILQS